MTLVSRALRVKKANPGQEVPRDLLDHMVPRANLDLRGLWVRQVRVVCRANRVRQASMDLKVNLDHLAQWGRVVPWECLVPLEDLWVPSDLLAFPDLQALPVLKVKREIPGHKGGRGIKEIVAHLDVGGPPVLMVPRVSQVPLAPWVPLVQ